jgi:hypothetical protein
MHPAASGGCALATPSLTGKSPGCTSFARHRQCYIQGRLVKRSRALRGRNPTRDNQARAARTIPLALVVRDQGRFVTIPHRIILLPCHASENPPLPLQNTFHPYPQILLKSLKKNAPTSWRTPKKQEGARLA